MSALGFTALFGALATVFYRSVWPERNPWWTHRIVFVLLLILALGIFQRDAIQANFQLWNPDESQMLAGALTLQQRHVFWLDSDGHTHGPLNQWPLIIPALFGAQIDYTSARVIAAGFTVMLLVFLQATLSRYLQDGSARLLVLPAWTLFIFNQHPEAAQYSTELVPSLLIAGAVALRPQTADSSWRYFLIGLAAGAAPFAKLQIAPLTAWVLGFAAISLWYSASRWKLLASLALGAAVPALIFIGHAAANGALADFRIRYLEINLLGYVAQGATHFVSEYPSLQAFFGFSQFFWPVVVAIFIGGIFFLSRCRHESKTELLLAAGLVIAAFVAVYTPKKPFPHYFLLLIGPLTLLLGAIAGPTLEKLMHGAAIIRRALLIGMVSVGLCGFTIAHNLQHPDALRYIVTRWSPRIPRVLVEALQQRTTPGDTLAVWGWQPALYVMTQTIAATPDLVVFWQIAPSPWQEFYRTRYMQALTEHPPVVFVDTTGPADFFYFNSHDTTRYEIFPALRDYIETHYRLDATVAGARIYIRRESESRNKANAEHNPTP